MAPKIPTGGRPASPFPKRYAVRHDDARLAAWKAAAATCGVDLQTWIRLTLDAEARKATHVPLVQRKAVRRG